MIKNVSGVKQSHNHLDLASTQAMQDEINLLNEKVVYLENGNRRLHDSYERRDQEQQDKLETCENQNEAVVITRRELDLCRDELTDEQTSKEQLNQNLRSVKQNMKSLELENENLRYRIRRLESDKTERMKLIIDEPPPPPESSCGKCNKPVDMVLLIDNSKSVTEDYQLHDEYARTAANFVDLWFKPHDTTSSSVGSNALICRFSNRLQVDAKMVISGQSKGITYYDYGNAHGPYKRPPHYDFLVNKTPNLSLTAAKDKLSERLDALTRYGEPLPVGEERWAWRGDESNMIARRTRAENGEGTGSTFFYSMLGDLNDFVKDNQFFATDKKSFLFVLTESTHFHDDPRKWKEDDLRACENQEPDNFGYPYELSKYEVCDIFRGLAQSFREGF